MADQVRVRQWLIQLGRLTTAKMSAAEATDWLDVTAPALSRRFSDSAFTPASLEEVAAASEYLPTYGELVKRLREWVATYVIPDIPRVTHEPFATNDWQNDERRASWQILTPQDVLAKVRNLDGHPQRIEWGRALAAALVNNDAEHLLAALPPEFLMGQAKPDQTAEPAKPERTKGAQLASLGIGPAPTPMTAAERFRAIHGRNPGELTPDQLAAVRARTPGMTPAAE